MPPWWRSQGGEKTGHKLTCESVTAFPLLSPGLLRHWSLLIWLWLLSRPLLLPQRTETTSREEVRLQGPNAAKEARSFGEQTFTFSPMEANWSQYSPRPVGRGSGRGVGACVWKWKCNSANSWTFQEAFATSSSVLRLSEAKFLRPHQTPWAERYNHSLQMRHRKEMQVEYKLIMK